MREQESHIHTNEKKLLTYKMMRNIFYESEASKQKKTIKKAADFFFSVFCIQKKKKKKMMMMIMKIVFVSIKQAQKKERFRFLVATEFSG